MTNQMKLKQTVLLVMGLLPLGVIAQTNNPVSAMVAAPQPPSAAMPDKDTLSYAIGMYFGRAVTNAIRGGVVSVDTNTVIEAIEDVITGKPTRLSDRQLTAVLNQFRAM